LKNEKISEKGYKGELEPDFEAILEEIKKNVYEESLLESPKKPSESKKLGRPSKFKEDYCLLLLQHMSRGFSFESFAAICSVTRRSIYQWEEDYPIFSHTKKAAESLRFYFWESIGIKAIKGQIKNFPVPAWIFTMKNVCKWRDTPDKMEEQVAPIIRIAKDEEDL
jgi:hypothetical protein